MPCDINALENIRVELAALLGREPTEQARSKPAAVSSRWRNAACAQECLLRYAARQGEAVPDSGCCKQCTGFPAVQLGRMSWHPARRLSNPAHLMLDNALLTGASTSASRCGGTQRTAASQHKQLAQDDEVPEPTSKKRPLATKSSAASHFEHACCLRIYAGGRAAARRAAVVLLKRLRSTSLAGSPRRSGPAYISD